MPSPIDYNHASLSRREKFPGLDYLPEEMMNMVSHLQKLNESNKRKKEDIRAYVKDLLRVFDTSAGGFSSGYSGDVGDGPTDAYKALNPKPWKASP